MHCIKEALASHAAQRARGEVLGAKCRVITQNRLLRKQQAYRDAELGPIGSRIGYADLRE